MPSQAILAYVSARGFHSTTVERWLQLSGDDQEILLELTQTLKLGENHFRDFLDWLEEISLRDGISLGAILKGETFSRLLSDPRLGRSDKLKRVKEELRRLRFPRLSQIEKEIEEKIRALKLSPKIQISAPPGLEGGSLTIQMRMTRYDELRRLVEELSAALEKKEMEGIFLFLRGGAES